MVGTEKKLLQSHINPRVVSNASFPIGLACDARALKADFDGVKIRLLRGALTGDTVFIPPNRKGCCSNC